MKTDANTVCKLGFTRSFYEEMKEWLHAKEERRLFCIDDAPDSVPSDPRVQIFPAGTLLERELALKKIAWMSLFQGIHACDAEVQGTLQTTLAAAELIALDAADFGASRLRHLRSNFRKPMRRFSALKSSMQGVPAIVIGPGPSLEKNGHLLKAWQDRALLIATGNALHAVKTKPSCAVLLDPHQGIRSSRYSDVPFCIQGRTHPHTRKASQGEVLYFPDSHFAFEPYLTGETLLNTGWSVGNAGVAIALELGCDPIYLIGMDSCYRKGQKYAWKGDEVQPRPLIETTDAAGQPVLTQTDWLMSLYWFQEMAATYPDRTFINATAEGMKMAAPVQTGSLPAPPMESGVEAKWQALVKSAPLIEWPAAQVNMWMESLRKQDDLAKELLLDPLWRVWGSIFERELMIDPHPIPMEEKLAIQKRLLFERIVGEHLSILGAK